MRILINASNLEGTGPTVVMSNVVPLMARLAPEHEFILLLPSTKAGQDWALSSNVEVRYVTRMRFHELGRMVDIHYRIARLCGSANVDVCFTVGDIGPVNPGVPHVVCLHNSYLTVPDSDLAHVLPVWERLKLSYSRYHFRRLARTASAVTVQTPVMADQLHRRYAIDSGKVHIIPSVLPGHLRVCTSVERQADERIVSKKNCLRLLFLATYYAHKNHAVLLPLIDLMRRRGLAERVHIFLTLSGDRSGAEAALLRKLAKHTDIVTNLGHLAADQVGPSLKAVDALFLPTLAESFGLTYIEARATGTPILTSRRDFASWICGDEAIYFDPTDPVSIADEIERFACSGGRAQRQQPFVTTMPVPNDWSEVASRYLDLLVATSGKGILMELRS